MPDFRPYLCSALYPHPPWKCPPKFLLANKLFPYYDETMTHYYHNFLN